jgi:hypothetical protein
MVSPVVAASAAPTIAKTSSRTPAMVKPEAAAPAADGPNEESGN